MPSYEVKNISRILIYEDLDTTDGSGAKEVLRLRKRESATLTQAQWQSASVQKHINKGRLRSRQV
jgi:hypothetical protein